MPAKRLKTLAQAPQPPQASPRPRVESARLRDIYSQACRLFVERGYEATSMSDIAEAVKITKAGLYHFVTGKEDLLFTIMSFGMDELEEEVVHPAGAIEDPRARLEFIIRAHVANIARGVTGAGNPVTLVVDEPWGLSGEKQRVIDDRKRVYFELIRRTLGELRDNGRLRDSLDLAVASHSIIGMILWTARWRRPGGRLKTDDVSDQLVQLVLSGVVRSEEA